MSKQLLDTLEIVIERQRLVKQQQQVRAAQAKAFLNRPSSQAGLAAAATVYACTVAEGNAIDLTAEKLRDMLEIIKEEQAWREDETEFRWCQVWNDPGETPIVMKAEMYRDESGNERLCGWYTWKNMVPITKPTADLLDALFTLKRSREHG